MGRPSLSRTSCLSLAMARALRMAVCLVMMVVEYSFCVVDVVCKVICRVEILRNKDVSL